MWLEITLSRSLLALLETTLSRGFLQCSHCSGLCSTPFRPFPVGEKNLSPDQKTPAATKTFLRMGPQLLAEELLRCLLIAQRPQATSHIICKPRPIPNSIELCAAGASAHANPARRSPCDPDAAATWGSFTTRQNGLACLIVLELLPCDNTELHQPDDAEALPHAMQRRSNRHNERPAEHRSESSGIATLHVSLNLGI